VHGPVAECFVPKNDGKLSEPLYQVKNFHSFLWASGGLFSISTSTTSTSAAG
jgi:hypothetical protein